MKITGGGDCSIRSYALKDTPQSTSVCCRLAPVNKRGSQCITSAPRMVFLLEQTALCLTEQGYELYRTTYTDYCQLSCALWDIDMKIYSFVAANFFTIQSSKISPEKQTKQTKKQQKIYYTILCWCVQFIYMHMWH